MRLTPLLVGLAVASCLFGLLGPWSGSHVAHATTETVGLRVNPGPEHSPDNLSCLWHDACTSPPTAGNALDWQNNSPVNETTYWRSYGYRSITGNGVLGTATIIDNSGVCTSLRLSVIDRFGFNKGNIYYVHQKTWTPNASFNILAASTWTYTQATIGFSWGDELPSCKNHVPPLWTGQHLHQGADAAYYAANTAVFTSLGSYAVDSFANWQYSQSWVWNY